MVAMFYEECKQHSRTYHEFEKIVRQIRLSREMMGKKKNFFAKFNLRSFSSCFYISIVKSMCLRTLSS
jgi:hypothetical protein